MKLKSIFIAMALMLGASPAIADTAIGAKISTLGLGVEVTTNVVPMLLNVRVLGSAFDYATTINDTGVNYDATLQLQSAGAILDLYPFAGKFRISGGVFYNGNSFSLVANPTQTAGTPFAGSTMTSTIDFNTFAPYVGIGFGDAVSSGSPVGFNLELGVMSQGSPQVNVTSNNALIPQATIDAEKASLENAVSNFKYYPVIGVGMTFKF